MFQYTSTCFGLLIKKSEKGSKQPVKMLNGNQLIRPEIQTGNGYWVSPGIHEPQIESFLGIPYFLAPFYSIILLTATTTYMQMEPQFQLQLSGCINQQNPVKQNPLSISCLRAIDYAVLIFFTVFMLSGLFLFVFRIVNKKVSLRQVSL